MSTAPKNIIIDGRYQIGECIGVGGMGCVYEALHVGIGRRVAIKTLRAEEKVSNRAASRLQREAKIGGRIGHDHICEVIDTGMTDEGVPYLVMPLLAGRTLKSLIETEAPLNTTRAAEILEQVLEGMSAAHALGIVHRDLKPSNVFLTRVGAQGDFVKILDFGISKQVNLADSCSLTKTGTVLGTPYYMSPEQACGVQDIDHRTDIYSAGVLLYEMSTGVRPFHGDSYNEIITRIAGAPITPPSALNPAIPKSLNRFILRAMSRDPSDRFADTEEMIEALRLLKQGVSMNAQGDASMTKSSPMLSFNAPSHKGRRLRTVDKKKRTAMAVASMIVLVVVLVYAIASFMAKTAVTNRELASVPVISKDVPLNSQEPIDALSLQEKVASAAKIEAPEPEITIPVVDEVISAPQAPDERGRRDKASTPIDQSAKSNRTKLSTTKNKKTKTTFLGKNNTLFSEEYGQ